jgi:hypothetical protein
MYQALRELFAHSGIVRLEGDRVQYRHDRIRDHLFARAMRVIATRPGDHEAFFDPYFAELAAEALVALDAPAALGVAALAVL